MAGLGAPATAERARCLSELAARLESAGDMAELVTTENGSPITRSRSSNGLAPVRTYRYHAGLAADLADDEIRDWHGQQTIVHSTPAADTHLSQAGSGDNNLRIAQEEIVGPVLAVTPYETEDEAVRLANASVYGLSGSVFTSDIGHGAEIARRIDTGVVNINGYRAAPNAPAGGHKASGLGPEGGPEGLLAYRKQMSIGLPPR